MSSSLEQTKKDCAAQLKALKCCVIIPTYNNATTLEKIIADVSEYCTNILVVNDGSTDETASILAKNTTIQQLSYQPNQGKGIALRKGFDYAIQQGFDYAITIDSDGQHYAKDLPTFADTLSQEPQAILIGSRNLNQKNIPTKSNFGNKFSSFWLWVETGIRLQDTQSGYRLYPIKAIQNYKFITGRYEFEVEILVKAAWEGIKLMGIGIDVYYPPANERISHFRPFRDFFRISLLNTFLCTLAFFWYRPRLLFRQFKKKA